MERAEETGLIPMTPSRRRLREGDVFLVQPFPGVFRCGKVICTKVKSRDAFVNGMNLIYLYDKSPDGRAVPGNLEDAPLLIPPMVINRLPWSRGYFETIGHQPVTERERQVPFGFWDVPRKRFVSLAGEPLAYEPLYWTYFGLASYAVVGETLQKALRVRGVSFSPKPHILGSTDFERSSSP